MQTFTDIIAEAWHGIWRTRGRALLSLFGIILGTGGLAVVLSVFQIEFLQSSRRARDYVSVSFPSVHERSGKKPRLARHQLTLEDAAAIRQNSPYVEKVIIRGSVYSVNFKAGREHMEGRLIGTSATDPQELSSEFQEFSLQEGRFFTPQEIEQAARVAVINIGLKKQFFGGAEASGRQIRLDGVQYKVIGVLASRGTYDLERAEALIPHLSFNQLYMCNEWYFKALPKKDVNLKTAALSIDAVLKARIGDPNSHFVDWGAISPEQIGGFVFVGVLGLLMLLSAGIAVSNKTYIGALERLDQFALRRALGAGVARLYSVVMLESVLLCVVGATIGCTIGRIFFVMMGRENLQRFAEEGLKFGLPLGPFAALVLFILLVGAASGLQGAAVAAKADPAQLLGRKDIV